MNICKYLRRSVQKATSMHGYLWTSREVGAKSQECPRISVSFYGGHCLKLRWTCIEVAAKSHECEKPRANIDRTLSSICRNLSSIHLTKIVRTSIEHLSLIHRAYEEFRRDQEGLSIQGRETAERIITENTWIYMIYYLRSINDEHLSNMSKQAVAFVNF